MNISRLALPESPWSKAYQGVVNLIRSDPTLKAAGVKIRAWDGEAAVVQRPTQADLPLVKLTPVDREAGWETERQHKGDLGVVVDLVVEGTRASDIFNLWHAIRGAIYPENVKRREARNNLLNEAGVPQITIERHAIAVRAADSQAAWTEADGLLAIEVFVETPEI